MHRAILKEIDLRRDFLERQQIDTIYFGGGTPSLLSGDQVSEILNSLNENFLLIDNLEITLEANPDDLTAEKLLALKSAGINRLSIGIQTFDNERLKYVNRTHTAEEARKCVSDALAIGFENLTADLIYAIPPDSMDYWEADLEEMINLGLPHISLYGLTIEDKTVFGKWKANGRLKETEEGLAADQYRYAIEKLKSSGYEHYEVSNFCRSGFESKHNSSYWAGEKYLGLGPGAHSFDGDTRAYNIQNNPLYIKSIAEEKIPETIEKLTAIQKANEQILTRLRTANGLDLRDFFARFKLDLQKDRVDEILEFGRTGLVSFDSDHMKLTVEGFMVADEIALRLFYDQ